MDHLVNPVWYEFPCVIEVDQSDVFIFLRIVLYHLILVLAYLIFEFWKNFEKMIICTSHCGTIAS